MWIDTQESSQKESLSHNLISGLNHHIGGISSEFPYPIIMCLVHSSYMVYLRSPYKWGHTSPSQDGLYCKGLWVMSISLVHHSLRTQRTSVCMWSERFPVLRMKICGLGRAQPPLLIVLLFFLWRERISIPESKGHIVSTSR